MEKNNEHAASNGDQQEAETDPVDNMDEDTAAREKLTASDPNKVKFTSVSLDGYDGKNGEAKVDIQMSQSTVGMGKDELMKYANEPFWVRLRLILFILFWVGWVAMLVGAIVIIVLAPRCPPAPKVEWYQKTGMYQVEVATFKDSDGNGIGDFKGIIEKLDYLKNQHIGALMLKAFYKSESDAIVDHKEVDSKLGTLADFEELVQKLKEKDIKLIIDFVPNHSSDKHRWFLDSVEDQEPYSDFYVWADSASGSGNKNKPPNNWLSVDGGSAWEWNDSRQKFYLHTFGKDKPDLNLRNELVQQELREIVKFWMEKGVDGLNVIAASHLVEDSDFSKDEAVAVAKSPASTKYEDLNHLYTLNQPENIGLLEDWKQIIQNFSTNGIYKILMAEVSGSVNSTNIYYGNETRRLAELPYNNHFTKIAENPTGVELKHHLEMVENVPSYAWPAILVGSKDVQRLASRVGDELVDAIFMIATIAKGTPIMYYGDELGLPDYVPPGGELLTSHTVMLWDNDTSSGFSSGAANYPVHDDFEKMNVVSQEKAKQSHLKVFSRLFAMRGQPAISFGLQRYPIVTNQTFSLARIRKGSPGYLIAVNLGSDTTTLDFSGKDEHLPEMGRVEVRSTSITSGPLIESDHPKIALNSVPLGPKQAVLFSFVPIFN